MNTLALTIALLQATIAKADPKVTDSLNHQAPGQVIKHGKLVYTQIRIKATAAKVWGILTNFDAYPSWNPFITSISGETKVGSHLKAFLKPPHSKGMVFTPRVLQYQAQKELRWIGKLAIPRLFDGEHTFKVVENGDGSVTFIQYERFRGLLIPFFKKMLDKDTKNGFESMNLKLKELAERP